MLERGGPQRQFAMSFSFAPRPEAKAMALAFRTKSNAGENL
jgi:hypothetical protein